MEQPPTSTIWKFSFFDEFSLTVAPLSTSVATTGGGFIEDFSKPAHIGLDPIGNVCLWFKVWPYRFHSESKFQNGGSYYLHGTGQKIPFHHRHLGSCIQSNLVWHVHMDELIFQ